MLFLISATLMVGLVQAQVIFDATFDSGTAGFVYSDEAFNIRWNNPDYVDGYHTPDGGFNGTGALAIDLDENVPGKFRKLSGGWTREISTNSDATLSLRFKFKFTQTGELKQKAFVNVIAMLDTDEKQILELAGEGRKIYFMSTGWVDTTVDFGMVEAGTHFLTVGIFSLIPGFSRSPDLHRNKLSCEEDERNGSVVFDDFSLSAVVVQPAPVSMPVTSWTLTAKPTAGDGFGSWTLTAKPTTPGPTISGGGGAGSVDLTTAPPTTQPADPTRQPAQATFLPTPEPSSTSSDEPTRQPTDQTSLPTLEPSFLPSPFPTSIPTEQPLTVTDEPTNTPTTTPTSTPTSLPTSRPTQEPNLPNTDSPTYSPLAILPPSPPAAARICPDDFGSQPGYSMCVDLVVDPQDEILFTRAAEVWSSKIVGDLDDYPSAGLQELSCNGYPTTIDDLYLCGVYSDIDGVNGVLGSAGPRFVRNSDGLPVIGFMEFDSSDVNELREQGLLADVIEHEMAHIIGLGTLWELNGVTTPDSEDCTYLGENANREWQSLTGCVGESVPTELDGGAGTRCGHFDEECLLEEVMTGFLQGEPTKFSRITIGAIEDLGYVVPDDYDEVTDEFSAADINPACVCGDSLNDRQLRGGKNNVQGRTRTQRGSSGGAGKRGRFGGKNHTALSEEGRSEATRYGKNKMKKAREEAKECGEGLTFIGDKYISVMYVEAGEVHLLEVWGDDKDDDVNVEDEK